MESFFTNTSNFPLLLDQLLILEHLSISGGVDLEETIDNETIIYRSPGTWYWGQEHIPTSQTNGYLYSDRIGANVTLEMGREFHRTIFHRDVLQLFQVHFDTRQVSLLLCSTSPNSHSAIFIIFLANNNN